MTGSGEAGIAAATGRSRGIGRAIVEALLLAGGASVAICGHSEDSKAGFDEMAPGDCAPTVPCDVARNGRWGFIAPGRDGGVLGFAEFFDITNVLWPLDQPA